MNMMGGVEYTRSISLPISYFKSHCGQYWKTSSIKSHILFSKARMKPSTLLGVPGIPGEIPITDSTECIWRKQ